MKLGQAELLVIDEAAAIPLPLVKKLLGPYLVFMASTINGSVCWMTYRIQYHTTFVQITKHAKTFRGGIFIIMGLIQSQFVL